MPVRAQKARAAPTRKASSSRARPAPPPGAAGPGRGEGTACSPAGSGSAQGEAAAHSVRVRVRVVSARGLRQGHLFRAMTPCAVISVPGCPMRLVTPPAARESDTCPVWNALATFQLHGPALTPLVTRRRSSRPESHATLLKKTRPLLPLPGLGALAPPPAQACRCRSGGRATQLSPSPEDSTPCPCPCACPCVVVDIFSGPGLRCHLGWATLPLGHALPAPGASAAATLAVVRRGSMCLGRPVAQGTLHVVVSTLLDPALCT